MNTRKAVLIPLMVLVLIFATIPRRVLREEVKESRDQDKKEKALFRVSADKSYQDPVMSWRIWAI